MSRGRSLINVGTLYCAVPVLLNRSCGRWRRAGIVCAVGVGVNITGSKLGLKREAAEGIGARVMHSVNRLDEGSSSTAERRDREIVGYSVCRTENAAQRYGVS